MSLNSGEVRGNMLTRRALRGSRSLLFTQRRFQGLDGICNYHQFMAGTVFQERRLGIAMGMELLALCDEVWVFGEATEGMAAEIASATEQGKEIIFKETEGM